MFHRFPREIAAAELPSKFTFPFCYTPHPLCVEAARLVQEQLPLIPGWQEDLAAGKMFGVLVVQDKERDEVGFLAAFSGNVGGVNTHPYFVPPICDLLDPAGFFKPEEARISAISRRIDEKLHGDSYLQLLAERDFVESEGKREVEAFRTEMREKKRLRAERRNRILSGGSGGEASEALAALTKESQFMKAELKRKERALSACLAHYEAAVRKVEEEAEALKEERRERSALLQNEIFENYVLLNGRGEEKNILQIFSEYSDRTAPAGTGECAAPKLLQYAYLHGLQPLAMAEFWWGASPASEIRHQGHFYPSCHSKCGPLLAFMLEGLEVEANPMAAAGPAPVLETVYEDEWLMAVVKPAGLLSVPGKTASAPAGIPFMDAAPDTSVWALLHQAHPEFSGPLIIHRLDMATSGVLLIAKSMEAYVRMQQLFESRQVKKRYVAVLEGERFLPDRAGRISLPLCPDVHDRPRQMVSQEDGKEALTDFEVLSEKDGHTRIAFYPITGRTHQLRVHAAHPLGLNTPILGDTLYGGTRQDRLYLHAESLEFVHPFTGRSIVLHAAVPF